MSNRTRRRHPTAACAHLRGPNQKRVADITEVRVSDYKAHLSSISALFDDAVVGHTIGTFTERLHDQRVAAKGRHRTHVPSGNLIKGFNNF